MGWAIACISQMPMNNNRLFNLSRLSLAGYYAGAMGLILGLCGIAVYEMTSQDHWRSLDQELHSLAGTLHDGLEPILQRPGRIEPDVQRLLPNLCVVATGCSVSSIPRVHVLGATHQQGYYVQFFNLSKQLVATAGGNPVGLPFEQKTTRQQPLQDQQGNRYHQVSVKLKASDGQAWGYLKVGRSLDEYDAHLNAIQTFLLLGLPLAMLLVGGAGWWLAGLAMQPVYQSYQQMQQFTADAAHELRTPIAAIQATVETTLNEDDLTLAEARSTLQTIERQNHRLSRLVQDLLLLSRMDLQVAPPTSHFCCLNDLVSDLVEEFAGLAIAAGIVLQAELRVRQPVYVAGDEEQLYRLVANLVRNAIDYTPAGGMATVILEQNHHATLIHVQDTGIGIAAEDQARIFDRFYRVSRDRSRKTGGSGLGLAIAQAIVQRHHGSLQVQSQLNRGSTFTVEFPQN
jgi:signal transduction histidine kinase